MPRISVLAQKSRRLSWTLTCVGASSPVVSLELATAAPTADFNVAPNCRGQILQLAGRAGDLPQQVDVTISALSLTGGTAK